jgi:hypothetical protein
MGTSSDVLMPKRFWSRLCENTKISVSISTYSIQRRCQRHRRCERLLAVRIVLNQYTLTDAETVRADMVADGAINAGDLVRIMQAAMF